MKQSLAGLRMVLVLTVITGILYPFGVWAVISPFNFPLALAAGRRGYVHVARGEIAVDGQRLAAGDAAMITDSDGAVLSGGKDAEVLAFDLP